MFKPTDTKLEKHFYDLQQKFSDTFTKHNDVSYSLFNSVAKFSELLPNSLNNLTVLSDMVTDALVVSGKSSLSRSVFNLPIISNTLNIDKVSSTVSLNYIVDKDYSVNIKKSFLQSSNNYSIFNKTKTSLLSFEDLLRGSPILIETPDEYFKYTFALSLESSVNISSIDIKLSVDTESYPLISEIYYINSENKKVYVTILNTSENKMSLDDLRQKDNLYRVLLPNIKANRIYLTMEDREKSTLSIDSISVKKLKYDMEGEVVVGPVTSENPILKTAIEVLGDTEKCNFFISPDKETWYELAVASDIPFSSSLNKILAFNTVSSKSVKRDTDFKEFYLKIYMKRYLDKEGESALGIYRELINSTGSASIDENATNATVYKTNGALHYGASTFKKSEVATNLLSPYFVYCESGGQPLVRGFIEHDYVLSNTKKLQDVTIVSKPLRISAEQTSLTEVDPLTVVTKGYSVSVTSERINTQTTQDIVLLLKDSFSKDVYTLVQDDKEIKVDLSLGYIKDTTEVLFFTGDSPVTILDSTLREIVEVTPKAFGEIFYISLVEEGFFEIPKIGSNILNTLYPFELNKGDKYSLSGGKITCKEALVDCERLSRVSTEIISNSFILSKENGNNIKIEDESLTNKYTERSEEYIPAYTDTTVIKLRNKFIKRGSLVLSVDYD